MKISKFNENILKKNNDIILIIKYEKKYNTIKNLLKKFNWEFIIEIPFKKPEIYLFLHKEKKDIYWLSYNDVNINDLIKKEKYKKYYIFTDKQIIRYLKIKTIKEK